MKFIAPVPLSDAMLIASNVAETDYAAWSAATSYTVGQRVIRTTTHKIYECLIAGVDATLPEVSAALTVSPHWLEIGATNRWKMFDQRIGSITENASSIVVTIAPSEVVTSLVLLDLFASSVRVEVKNGPGGATVYDKTFDVSNDATVGNWFDYFFGDVKSQETLIVDGLPIYRNPYITLTISGSGVVECGTAALGNKIVIGDTLVGAGISIIDYSKKNTDAFGISSIIQRNYAKKYDCSILVNNNDLDYVARHLSDVRAYPCIWIASNSYDSLIVYGFFKDWSITIPYRKYSECRLTIEGLV